MPDWKPVVRRRLEALSIDAATRNDLVDEIAADLDDRFAALVSAGETPEDATRTLEADLEEMPVGHFAAAIRPPSAPPVPGAPAASVLAGLWQDVRYAVRSLRRAPLAPPSRSSR
jgi:hypothetical protein